MASYVPTTMALGVISGMGPLADLWCGVIVGIVAAGAHVRPGSVLGPSWVLGELTGLPLTGSATWLGLMVGTPP